MSACETRCCDSTRVHEAYEPGFQSWGPGCVEDYTPASLLFGRSSPNCESRYPHRPLARRHPHPRVPACPMGKNLDRTLIRSLCTSELGYLAAQHFLYFRPLPQGQGSLRPAWGAVTARGCSRDAMRARGSRLCRKKRFVPSRGS